MYDRTATIDGFLSATAARQPVPGGGSVAALAGALSAAMGEMVVNYSLGKKSLEAFQGELRPAVEELNRARTAFLQLMEEDQTAYQALSQMQKLPETDPRRQGQFDAAVAGAIRVPQSIAGTAVGVLETCDRMVNFINPYLLADLAVCADLAMATVRCAAYNVRVNQKLVRDPDERRNIESVMGQLLERAAIVIQQVVPRIWARDEQIA